MNVCGWSRNYLCFCRIGVAISAVLSSPAGANESNEEDESTVESTVEQKDDAFEESDDFPALEEVTSAYETVVRGYRILSTDETTGFAETIEVSEEAKTVKTVSEVLSTAVGVQVRRLGGLGSYGAASIRGSTPSQVPIFLDGVQLNAGGFPSVNLGDLTLDTFGEMQIYRGGAPVTLGTSGIGGAIALETRRFDEPVTEIAMSYGSWNSWRLLTLQGARIGEVQGLALLTAQGADGDFEYLNQNGTPRNETDDRTQHRQNNKHVAYSGLVKLDGPLGKWKWTAFNDLFVKRQGIPGIGNIPTQNATLRTLRNTVTMKLKRVVSERFSLDLETNYMGMREDFDDTKNEIGVGHQRTLSQANAAGLSATPTMEWNDHHATFFRVGARYEVFSHKELMQDIESDLKWRVRTEIGLQHEWSLWNVLLMSPALRVEIHNTRYDGGQGPISVGEIAGGSVDEHYWSPSFGVRLEIVPGLFLRANGGRYVRTPDIAELFGDRGAVVGNPGLRPEVGTNTDAGMMYLLENAGPLSLMRIEAAWFGAWVEDLIAYVQNSQNTVRPENIDNARILGGEASLRSVFFETLVIEGNYTYLHGINLSDKPYHRGKRLPGRPAHEAFGRIEASHAFNRWGSAIWFCADYAGRNYLDQANFKADALARLYFGAGVRVSHHVSGFSFTVEAKNILDKTTARDDEGRLRPLRDFEGFPLPGRTIFATLHWSTSSKEER